MTTHPLDHAVWASLTGPHAHLARGSSQALGYPAEVSPFVALRPFLHTATDNFGAIRLYDFLGFTVRRKIGFVGVRTPQ